MNNKEISIVPIRFLLITANTGTVFEKVCLLVLFCLNIQYFLFIA